MKEEDNPTMSQHKREATTRNKLANNKNSVVTQKLCHDTELSRWKDSQVATWKLGHDINTCDKKMLLQQESRLLATELGRDKTIQVATEK